MTKTEADICKHVGKIISWGVSFPFFVLVGGLYVVAYKLSALQHKITRFARRIEHQWDNFMYAQERDGF